jgi:hypothetical protein
VWGDVFDLEAHDVTTAKRAVDREVEQGQVTFPVGNLKSRSDGPDVFRLERRLGTRELALIPQFMR